MTWVIVFEYGYQGRTSTLVSAAIRDSLFAPAPRAPPSNVVSLENYRRLRAIRNIFRSVGLGPKPRR